VAERVRDDIVWRALLAELERVAGEPAVLDVGGGTGVLAVPLAQCGARVTVIDTSADAIATLERRAAGAGVLDRVHGRQGDLDTALSDENPGTDHRSVEKLPVEKLAAETYDLVVCHSVLEYVDDPAAAVRALGGAVRPGGALSLIVANRAATVLGRAIGGHFAAARYAAADPQGRYAETDPLRQRYDLAGITALLDAAGLRVEQAHGVRIFTDLVAGAAVDGVPGAAEELRQLEDELADRSPYRDLAAQLHVLARRA
jgi:S-adenosylmethionine-dependent methyltransferase